MWKVRAAAPSKAVILTVGERREARNPSPPDFGEPLLDTGGVAKRGKTYSFSNPGLKGRHGERVTMRREGGRAPPPKLRIRNVDGSYNRRFTFEYG